MIKIQLADGSVLDNPPDLDINVIHNNPLLVEQGSLSLPVLFPETPHNVRLFKYVNRLDRTYKHKPKQRAVISRGAIQLLASLETLGASDEGIDTFFKINESEMYAKMKETQLSTVFEGIVRQASEFLPGEYFADDMDRLIKYLERVMMGYYTDDFLLFPIGTETWNYTTKNNVNYSNIEIIQALNDIDWNVPHGTPLPNDFTPDGKMNYRTLLGRKAHTIKVGSDEVEVAKGYGITPFLKESYIIKQIFTYFGYELKPDCLFFTHALMKRTVYINNTADSIMKSEIRYSQLVPDCTVSEFLDSVCKDYGCQFYITSNLKTIYPVFWKNMLDTSNGISKDYTSKLGGRPKTEFGTPQLLKITCDRSIADTSRSANTKHEFVINSGQYNILASWEQLTLSETEIGIYFIKSIGIFVEKHAHILSSAEWKSNPSWSFIDSSTFDYYKPKEELETMGYEYNEVDNKRCHLPYMDAWRLRGVDWWRDLLHCIGKTRHLNTVLRKKVEKSTSTYTTEVDINESNPKCPIVKAFHRIDYVKNIFNWGTYYEAVATMYNSDQRGNALVADGYHLVPGVDGGLHDYFYKEYSLVLQHSFHTVTAQLNFDEKDFLSFRMDELIIINGQPMIPQTLEYTLSNRILKLHSATFRTVRLYKDKLPEQ